MQTLSPYNTMSHYIVEEKLDSTQGQKVSSGLMASVITAFLLGILWFVKIGMPNPPLDMKEGVLELDMGVVDGGFGNPNSGGPSPTPPALGDNQGDGGGDPSPSGGEGKVVTNEGENSVKLPPIDPPKRGDQTDPNLAKRLKVGKRTGKSGNQNGEENGNPEGLNNTSSGPGKKPGNYGTEQPGKGTGLFSYKFTNFKLNSSVTYVNADGSGNIVVRVRVDCNGKATVVTWNESGTTYNGTDANMRQVFLYFLGQSYFTKVGDKCPESGLVTLSVKQGI